MDSRQEAALQLGVGWGIKIPLCKRTSRLRKVTGPFSGIAKLFEEGKQRKIDMRFRTWISGVSMCEVR